MKAVVRMRLYDNKTKPVDTGNKGFSLIELLISISILAILVVPLLNNFVTAAKVNSKAKKMQNETILAQNILEDIKAKSVKDLAAEFNYPEDFDSLVGELSEVKHNAVTGGYEEVNDLEKSSIKTVIANPSGVSSYTYQLVEKREEPYYFAMKNIVQNSHSYDALITLDGTAYIETNAEDMDGDKIGFNTFEMPVISELDPSKNILAIQSYEEDLAITELYENHVSYCVEQEKIHKDDIPPFSVTYYTTEDIKENLCKKILITISSVSGVDHAKVEFLYTAPTIPGAGSAGYVIEDKDISTSEGGVYVFYNPSRYNDTIEVTKSIECTGNYDIYVVKQKVEPAVVATEKEKLVGILPAGVNLYSNIDGISSKKLVKKDSAKNRIYKVKVQLFKAGSNFNSNNLCAEFISTKED